MNKEQETNEPPNTNQKDPLFQCDNLKQLNEQHHADLLVNLRRRLQHCILEKSLISTGYHLTQAAFIDNPQLNQTYETYVSNLKATHEKVFTRFVFYEVDSQNEPSQAQLDDLIRNGFPSSDVGVTFCKHLDIALLHEYSKRKSRVYFLLAKVTYFNCSISKCDF